MYLIQTGFLEPRIRIIGYASNKPRILLNQVKPNEIESARALNRRVSLLVY